MRNYQNKIKRCEHMCCTIQDKVHQVQKGAGTYPMLDCCSQETFINSELTKKLRTKSVMTTVKIKTLNGEESRKTGTISDLKATSSTGKNVWIDLPVSYTREILPVGDEDIAIPDKINDWKYLERTADKIIQRKNIGFDLLIDGNCSEALETLQVIPSKYSGPYAFRNLLRWCLVGPIDETASSTTVSCNRTSAQVMTSKTVASYHFAMETEVKDVGIEQMVHRMYTADFNNHCPLKKGEDITEMLAEDRSFMTLKFPVKCSQMTQAWLRQD